MSFDWKHRDATPGKPFSAGLPPGNHALHEAAAEYLRRRRLDYPLALRNGWYPSDRAGDSLPRLVIPASSTSIENKYWQARALVDTQLRYQSPHGVRRGDAVVIVWPRNDEIGHAAITEGPMDALAAAGEGVLGIALMGKNPPEEVLHYVTSLTGSFVTAIIADIDALSEAAELLRRLIIYNRYTRVISTYPYHDLADVPPKMRQRYVL